MRTCKTEFEMVLHDTPNNQRKSQALCALDIMFDDLDNPLPDEFYNFFNGEAGDDMPWGTKVKITIEVVDC